MLELAAQAGLGGLVWRDADGEFDADALAEAEELEQEMEMERAVDAQMDRAREVGLCSVDEDDTVLSARELGGLRGGTALEKNGDFITGEFETASEAEGDNFKSGDLNDFGEEEGEGSGGGVGESGMVVELSHCYNGCTSNAELLTYYGLVAQSLPLECARASVVLALNDLEPYSSTVTPNSGLDFMRGAPRLLQQTSEGGGRRAFLKSPGRELREWKLSILEDVGLSATRQEFEIGLPGEPYHVPPDLLGYLRLCAISEQVTKRGGWWIHGVVVVTIATRVINISTSSNHIIKDVENICSANCAPSLSRYVGERGGGS
ncbi:hypothetical protein T492DRAFT_309920 [Pavlovales sp. CCMP2436]|nr:hypothetical protein T492DRAFT_309920 [Pavlovales sp. CCMP2436]